MTGREFEIYLSVLFRNLGYKVKLTKASGDYGADLILKKSGLSIVVQAKRYKKKWGEICTRNHFSKVLLFI